MRNPPHINDRDNIGPLSPFWGKPSAIARGYMRALHAVEVEFSTFGDVNWNKAIDAAWPADRRARLTATPEARGARECAPRFFQP